MKKAQMKTFESIAVVLVFFFLLGFGIKFYYNAQQAELQDAKESFEDLDTIKALSILTAMPELNCAALGVQESACIDYFKAKAWEEITQDHKKRFFSLLGESTLQIEEVYPDDTSDPIVLYNNTPSDVAKKNADVEYVPITLYNPIGKGESYFAVLRYERFRS